MAQAIHITGLVAVHPPQNNGRAPGLLTNEQVAEIVRFPGPRQNEEDYANELVAIQGYCQWWADVGRNPELVGLEDFDIAIVAATHDPVPGRTADGTAEVDGKGNPTDGNQDIFVDPGVQLVVKHKKTEKTGQYDLNPPKGVKAGNYYRTTAGALIDLGKSDPGASTV